MVVSWSAMEPCTQPRPFNAGVAEDRKTEPLRELGPSLVTRREGACALCGKVVEWRVLTHLHHATPVMTPVEC